MANAIKDLFLLDPEITYLNHGSFGACPKPIFSSYQEWQLALEREPVQFITKKAFTALGDAKTLLAEFLNCATDDFFFLTNPTLAINQVVRSLDLKVGDEVLTTDHEYGAMDKTFDYYAKEKGFANVRQHIPIPIQSKDQFIEAFWKGYTEHTKAIFISHITSTTGLIFPVYEICREAKKRGLITIVDGAHVPGHVALDLSELQVDYYTGTMHKWMLAPKGSAFLYVHKAQQNTFKPFMISWGYESDAYSGNRFLDENEIQGTREIAAFLCTPAIFDFREKYQWADRVEKCKAIILEYYPKFCEWVGTAPICPVTNDFLGLLCSIPIRTSQPMKLKEYLYHQHSIEIPIMPLGEDWYMRIAFQAYNTIEELEKLHKAIIDCQKVGLLR